MLKEFYLMIRRSKPFSLLTCGALSLFVLLILAGLICGTFYPLLVFGGELIIALVIWQPLAGFCLMTFLIPLEDLTTLFPSLTLIKIIGLATFWGFLTQLFLGKKTFKTHHFFMLLAIYLGWCLLSLAWAIQPGQSWLRLESLAQLLALAILGYNLVGSKKDIFLILGSYFLGALAAAGLGIYNGFLHEFTTRTTICSLQDPNYFARLLGIGMIFSCYFILTIRNKAIRLISFLAGLGMLFAVLLSGSRGAWLALFFVLLIGLILFRKPAGDALRKAFSGSGPAKKARFLTALLFAFLLTFFAISKLPQVVSVRAQTLFSLSEERGAGRLDIWMVGLKILKENLALGVGLDNFPYAYTKYFSQIPGISPEIGLNKNPHNIFLATITELGIPGFILFLSLFVYLWRCAGNSGNLTDSALGKLLIVFLAVAGLTCADQHRKFFWLTMVIPVLFEQFGVLNSILPGRRIKILFLSPIFPNRQNPTYGVFSLRLVQNLQAAGLHVTVIAPVPYSPAWLWFNKEWRKLGLIPESEDIGRVKVLHPRYFCLPGGRFERLNGYFMFLAVEPVAEILHRAVSFSLVHSCCVFPSGYVGLLASHRLNLPSVCTAIGSDINVTAFKSASMTRMVSKILNLTGQVIAVGNELARKALQLQTDDRSIKVIYNGVDCKMFNTEGIDGELIRQKTGLKPYDRVILFVGRLVENKGVYELIEVFAQIGNKFLDTSLVLVGDGPEKEALGSLAKNKGLSERILLPGPAAHEDLVYWYAACEVFVLLSRHEGVPNVIAEAMSSGKPVVATRAGGIPELVEDARSGFLVKPGHTGEAVEALEKLLADPAAGREMGKRGREIIKSRPLEWKDCAAAYLEIFEQLTGYKLLK
ncbi:MAG: Glycosyl transferase group 1 [Desulfotomaculum sp. 46_296]|nr:MAG: Glycosyl transferase group 1 [Desulfotomaculum sp. 46_296]HAU32209.1 hypothetical protein [Desulfotomaculum sp.]